MRTSSLVAAAVAALPCVLSAQVSWTWRNPGLAPPPRSGHAMATDPASGLVLLFGGADSGGNLLAETWTWNGLWNARTPLASPWARRDFALAHDGQGFLLFGGQAGSALVGDTWRYDGVQWSMLGGGGFTPINRTGHAMARTAGGVLLFGGDNGTAFLADTWLWNGTSWSFLSPATSPPARAYHAMAYDGQRDRVVLFGGEDANGSRRDDTWEWDGATWMQRLPATRPSARSRTSLVYYPDRHAAVMFGGSSVPFGLLADTWEWDGQDWRQPTVALGPTSRSHHAMAMDRLRRMVMFGGVDWQNRTVGETWLYAQRGRAGFITFGAGCPGSAGVPTLGAAAGSFPWLGSTFSVEMGALPATPWATGVLGFSTNRWGALPLPASLTPLGLTGCVAYVSPAASVLLGVTGGTTTWPIPVPVNPALVGQDFFVQGLVSDPGVNPAGLTVTNAGEGRIGNLLLQIVETFDSEQQLDRGSSSGQWSGGSATFGAIGGDGLHGEFSPTLGTFLGTTGSRDTYLFDTDATLIPGSQTRTGQPITVTDGRYFFTRMVVPTNVRLRFVGSNPAVFAVRGEVLVHGEIQVDGEDVPPYNATTMVNGQPGGAGGVFAGRGGAGADRGSGQGPNPTFNGQPGQDVQVVAGHGYAGRVVGTGGPGSPQFPAHGQSALLAFVSFFCNEVAAGGGGGGSFATGGNGTVITNIALGAPQPSGALVSGGIAFNPFPIPANAADHFLIGGSGGGGGGSHALFANSFTPSWAPGGGGAGGGGAIALRAGDDLRVEVSALISARGGSGPQYLGPDLARVPAPGGGGSGGAIVLQSGRLGDVQGTIDLSPGFGSEIDKAPVNRSVRVVGGDGAPGFLRYELPTAPTIRMLPRVLPPATTANVGALRDQDPRVGFQSHWYATHLTRPPIYLRYEVAARINNAPVVYSDDPSVGVLARPGTGPVAVFLQGADLDPVTGVLVPGSIAPWRLFAGGFGTASGEPGLTDDGRNGFRFQILLDRSFGQSAEIDEVRVFFR